MTVRYGFEMLGPAFPPYRGVSSCARCREPIRELAAGFWADDDGGANCPRGGQHQPE